MKQFALALLILLGGIACAVTKTPHAGPATIPTPPASMTPASTAEQDASQETTKAAGSTAAFSAPILSDAPQQAVHSGSVSGQGPGRAVSVTDTAFVRQDSPPRASPPTRNAATATGRTYYVPQRRAILPWRRR